MAVYWICLLLALSLATIAFYPKSVPSGLGDKGVGKGLNESELPPEVHLRSAFVLSSLVFILMTGLRYGIGQDYFYAYVPYFQRVSWGFGRDGMEVGFYLLNRIVAIVSTEPTLVFLVCSVVFFSCTYAAIEHSSPNPVVSVFLLFGMSFIFIFMNAMRQMVAVSILLYGLRYVEQRRIGPFAVAVAVAASFHVSSLVFVVAYWFPKVKVNAYACVATVIFFFLIKGKVASALLTVVADTDYGGYLGSQFDTGESGYVLILINIAVLCAGLFLPRVAGEQYSAKYKIYLICQLIATLVAMLAGEIVLSQRVRWIFGLPAIILLPLAVSKVNKPAIRGLIWLFVFLLYVAYIGITIGLGNANKVVPYQSVLGAVL